MPSRNAETPAPSAQNASTESPETEATAPALPHREATHETAATIDWATANADFAALPRDEDTEAVQVASGDGPPAVPILLPPSNIQTASTDPAYRPRFQQLSDGYYASYPGTDYDIIVNGTNEVIGKSEGAGNDETFLFQPTGSGAMVAFSKYGADYLIEFECKNMAGDHPDCIGEDDAIAKARELVIARTR